MSTEDFLLAVECGQSQAVGCCDGFCNILMVLRSLLRETYLKLRFAATRRTPTEEHFKHTNHANHTKHPLLATQAVSVAVLVAEGEAWGEGRASCLASRKYAHLFGFDHWQLL